MAAVSEISWCDSTFNPWIGCTPVGPGCDHCYAARDNERRKWVPRWGAGVPRHRTKTWGDPIKWNAKAAATGYRPRVFCASLADVFDNEVPDEWRDDLWELIRTTPNLRWMLLTKRVGNVMKMVPYDWPFAHVGIMATMVNNEEFRRDWWKLRMIPAPWRGISAEPLLARIYLDDAPVLRETLHWVITGGESGPERRDLDMGAVRHLRDQCGEIGIAFHHKQNGGNRGKDNGCLIDGVEHKHFPQALAA
jgi:protein gp37